MAACGLAEEALFTGWICAILAFSLVLISSGIGWFYVCYLFGLVSCRGSSALRRPEGNNMVHQRVQGDTVIVWGSHLFGRGGELSMTPVEPEVPFFLFVSLRSRLRGHKCCNGSKGEEKVETLLSTSINRYQPVIIEVGSRVIISGLYVCLSLEWVESFVK
ncbi:unnamed protein product [Brassica rapa]|uniref:Uncharacterized protein n=1 Tax=Brassica campestris TaxID=3711 RepID=A0A3P5Z6N4_BRACM|nr:unnamed protein product [Brassica rapa]VDC74509.1 unnamed protein product [Brassica rapa]